MKKVFLALIAAASLFTANAQYAGQTTRQSAIKINPLSLFVLTPNVSYEKAVGEKQSFQLGAFYSGFTISDLKYSGVGVTPEYRFYLSQTEEALKGFYVAPFIRYQNFKFQDKETKDKATLSSFGGGATIGWQGIGRGGFVTNVFLGPSYNAGNIKTSSNEDFDIKGGINDRKAASLLE
jgi:hypothetical protein